MIQGYFALCLDLVLARLSCLSKPKVAFKEELLAAHTASPCHVCHAPIVAHLRTFLSAGATLCARDTARARTRMKAPPPMAAGLRDARPSCLSACIPNPFIEL